MLSWDLSLIICAILIITCTLADMILYLKREPGFHDKLVVLWVYLSVRSIRDLPERMVSITLRIYYFIFGRKYLSLRNLGITLILSFFLTFWAVMIGRFWEVKHHLNLSDSFNNTLKGLIPFDGFYSSQFLFPFNYVFDYSTIVVTMIILTQIGKCRNQFLRFVYILIDIVIAGFFALITMSGIKLITALLRAKWNFDFGMIVAAFGRSISTYFSFFTNPYNTGDWDSLFYSFTTFLPTSIYLLFIVLMLSIHSIDSVINRILLIVIQKVEEKPYTAIYSKLATLFTGMFILLNYIVARLTPVIKP